MYRYKLEEQQPTHCTECGEELGKYGYRVYNSMLCKACATEWVSDVYDMPVRDIDDIEENDIYMKVDKDLDMARTRLY